MNALLRKEIRLLLPSFVIALGLTFSIPLLPKNPSSGWEVLLFGLPFVCCPAMLVMTALDSFGREVSSGTFSNLLVLPLPRERIWWMKSLLLLVAAAIILGAWWMNFLASSAASTSPQDTREMMVGAGLFAFVVYSGGLWTVLLFRQVAAAFWFTLLVPGAIVMTIGNLTQNHPEQTNAVMVIGLVAYGIAGFLLGWRMFLRAQDVQWTGGTIALPNWMGIPRGLVWTRAKQGRHPRRALLAKEFQLHQSQLVVAGVIALLHLGVIATRKFGGDFQNSPILEVVFTGFWVLWFAMPLLIGSAAVAEERKLGTLEGQLCLPVRRRTQLVVKFAVALALSVLLGVAVPLVLEGSRILPDIHLKGFAALGEFQIQVESGIESSTSWIVIQQILAWTSDLLPFLTLAGIAALIGVISFYASSLARNTLQALAPAVLGIIVSWAMLVGASQIEDVIHYPLWRGPLIFLISVPVLTLTFAWLTYWNFKRLLVGWSVWRRNILTFLAALALVMASTAAIYHRTWEFLTPLEPAHNTARLTQSKLVAMQSDYSRTTWQLPDGKVWTSRFYPSSPNWAALITGNWRVVEMFGGGRFWEETNWASVAMCNLDAVGIQKDGSLWVSEQPEDPRMFWRKDNAKKSEPIKLVRYGNENNWKSVASHYSAAFLLKTDGTLWHLAPPLEPPKRPGRRKNWPGLRAFEPRRLGTDSDWAELSFAEGRTNFRKADGPTWVFVDHPSPSERSRIETIQLEEDIFIQRTPYLDRHRWRGLVWSSAPRSVHMFQVGVRDDGTFQVNAAWQRMSNTSSKWELAEQNIQLGKDSNWLAVSGNAKLVVSLKSDGSLWRWQFPADPITRPDTATATRLSAHSDWVAIGQALGGVVSLAADGRLWFWQFDSRDSSPWELPFPPLLAVSHKPQLIGNIFLSKPQ